MDVMLSSRSLINRLGRLVNWVTQGRWQIVTPPIDTLQHEIYQLEKTLTDTRPSQVVRHARSPEPVTEQQKIIDLAG